jgi:spermidine synthase
VQASSQGRSGVRWLAGALLFASGFAALSFQILWVQQAGLWLGQESAAVLAVVASFFGGLALGSMLAARLLGRTPHARRFYAACEALMGLWGMALILLLQPVAALLARWTGTESSPLLQWSVAFAGTFIVLLPGTIAMGATLPAMERTLRGLVRADAFGAMYAINTAGAMLGALGAAFWMIPTLGLARTALCCGGVNLVCAAAALALPDAAAATPPAHANASSHRPLPALLFATGLLAICFELAVVRGLSQLAQNTVYTYALLLSVYLAGTTLGALAQRRFSAIASSRIARRTLLLCGLALTTALALPLLSHAPALQQQLMQWLPGSARGALAAEAGLALLVFLPASFVMGLSFPQLVIDLEPAGIGPGRALAANTFGGSLAAPLFSFALPVLGLRGVLLAISAGYLLLIVRSRWAWAAAAALGSLAVIVPRLDLQQLPAGTHRAALWEGRRATVAVLEDTAGVRTLHIDNRQQEGSNTSTYADARQALLPLLLQPDPHRALFLGVGTGVTAAAATIDPGLEVEAVELLPEVLQSVDWFTDAIPAYADRSRLHLINADARRFVQVGDSPYDIIVADNFHPARSGTGALYAREHFVEVRRRLADHGLFCQWLPLHQLDLDSLASVVRSFMEVFPDAIAILATNSLETPTLGLVARQGAAPSLAELERRLAAMPQQARVDFDLADPFAVLGSAVAGPASLRDFSADAIANSDDQPIVAYRAPLETYAPESLPRDRLLKLVDAWQVGPRDVMAMTNASAPWQHRLGQYWLARNRYLHVGRDVKPLPGLLPMLRVVREPLLQVLRISPDFRPAYEPLRRMAAALGESDPAAGRALMDELAAATGRAP